MLYAPRFTLYDHRLPIENAPTARITSLRIGDVSEDWRNRASFKLDTGLYSNVYIALEGSEGIVEKLNRAIEDRLQAMIPWYARITKLDFVSLGFLSFFVLWGLATVLVALGLVPGADAPPRPLTSRESAVGNLLLVGIPIVIVILGWIMNRFKSALFPKATFAIGQGEQRYETLEKWRWVGIVGFVISLSAGLVLTMLR